MYLYIPLTFRNLALASKTRTTPSATSGPETGLNTFWYELLFSSFYEKSIVFIFKPYFCGQADHCMSFGDPRAIADAKTNIDRQFDDILL